MEHLPSVLNPYRVPQVPYLGGSYDESKDFVTYLDRRQDVDIKALQQANVGSPIKKETAQILQTWFYFGMLHEMLQLPVITTDFVRSSETGEQLITTSKLRDYLARWKQVNDAAKENRALLKQRNERLVKCSRITYEIWRGFNDFAGIIGPEIELSIHLLASALEHAASSVAGINVKDLPWRATRSKFVTQRLIDQGWCPSVVENLQSHNKVALPFYASLLGPPKDQSHLPTIGKEHPGCTATDRGCRAKIFIENMYKTKHVHLGCSCTFVEPNVEEVRRIVETGGIPVMCLTTDGIQSSLKVVKVSAFMQYTAFSHVWADGRGNCEANALPLCQVEKFLEYMRGCPWTRASKMEEEPLNTSIWASKIAIKEPIFTAEELNSQPLYFWIDTLCIPLSPLERRKDAIKTMRRVYQRANRVIVLDEELLCVGREGRPGSEEVIARITCSNWIRRLWTLQEAVPAKALYYQFARESFKTWRLEVNWIEHSFDNEVNYYADNFDFEWHSLLGLNSTARVMHAWGALHSRSTSKDEDEAICLATLLDMDVQKVLDVRADLRTRTLWRLHKVVPAGILCLPGKKLCDEGFKWAFTSFVDCSIPINPSSHPAYLTNEGLALTLHGILLKEPLHSSRSAVITISLSGKTYYIRQNLKRGNLSWEGNVPGESLNFNKMGKLAIILGQEPASATADLPKLDFCLGALLEVVKQDGGRLTGKYLRAVSVIGKWSGPDQHPTPPWSKLEELEKTNVVAAERTNAFQEWVVV